MKARNSAAAANKIKQQNLELYGSKIKKFRKRAGITAERLAEFLQISKSSVRNWECGLTRPDPDYLYRMFTILDVEPNEFFGICGIGTLLTDREKKLVDNYRSLGENEKENLEDISKALSKRSHIRLLKNAFNEMKCIIDRGRTAAAGKGSDWEDHPEEEKTVLLCDSLVSSADEIITVDGDSMEPQFHSGDRVLVKHCKELRSGDIGIFYVPGFGGVIKQAAYDRLHSLNPDYDDIFPYEDGAIIIGRVLGTITRDMIPTPEQLALYREAVETFSGE